VARWYEPKEGKSFGMFVYIYLYIFYLLSSPYLFVFGDDRVRGTRGHMMLMQVVLVRLNHGAGIAWEL